MPVGGGWHFVWAKADDQAINTAANTISFVIIAARSNVKRHCLRHSTFRSNIA
jgi:hypothetical protein